MKTSIAFLFALAFVCLLGLSNAFATSNEVAAQDFLNDESLALAESSELENEFDGALIEMNAEADSEELLEVDAGRRRRNARRARRNRKASRRAARRNRRANRRRTSTRSRKPLRRRNNKKSSSAMRSLANRMKRNGSKLRARTASKKLAAKKLVKKVAAKKPAVKKPLKKTVAKKSVKKTPTKKVAKKGGKKAKKSKKFAPKRDETLLKGNNASLKKRIAKVVNGEPDAAQIVQAKNAWIWEDRVVKRMDKFVPANNNELKDRSAALERESSEICTAAEGSCKPGNTGMMNLRTCTLAKKACYHSQVAIQKINRAIKQCGKVDDACAKKHPLAKGECGVIRAKCKKYVSATDYSVLRATKIAKKVRDMQLLDKDADTARNAVEVKNAEMSPNMKFLDEKESEYEECKRVDAVVQQCQREAKTDGKCSEAELKKVACKPLVMQYDEAKTTIEEQKKELNKLKAERDTAEADAAKGSV